MKSYVAHYKNKYPQGRVHESETAIDVYDASGEHCVALRLNGAGQWIDRSKEYGCKHEHCLAPIPKQARVHKLNKDGSLGLDDKAEERKAKGARFKRDGRIPSCQELKVKHGYEFDDAGNAIVEPKAQLEAPKAEGEQQA